MPQLFFKHKYVWFPVHLRGPEITDPSGQFADLIVYKTSAREVLYSHQILLYTFQSMEWNCLSISKHQRLYRWSLEMDK